MKKFLCMLLAAVCLISAFCGCGSDGTADTSASADAIVTPTLPPEDVFELHGSWAPTSLFYENEVYYFSKHPELADLYDTEFLIFDEYGKFLYINGPFFNEGFADELTKADNAYLLTCSSTYQYEYVNGEYVKVDHTSDSPTNYIAVFEPDLGIMFSDCHMENGKLSPGEFIFLYEKYSEDGDISSDDTASSATPKPTVTPKPTPKPTPTPKPVTFTNKYGTATTKCAHSGCNNYIATSGDTNCCTTHSNKCLNCRCYIDGDAMYCMSCLSSAANSTTKFTNKYGSATTKCAHRGCSNYIASSGDTNCCTTHSNRCLNCHCYIDEDAMYCMSCLMG